MLSDRERIRLDLPVPTAALAMPDSFIAGVVLREYGEGAWTAPDLYRAETISVSHPVWDLTPWDGRVLA